MSHPDFPDFTQDEHEAFMASLRRFGMSPDQVVGHLPVQEPGKTLHLTDGPETAIEPHRFVVHDVDEAKRLGGNADEEFENGNMEETLFIPDPWPEEWNDRGLGDLDEEHFDAIRRAHVAYVYGFSPRVESYRTIINKLNYPLEATAAAAKDLPVTGRVVLNLHAYVFHNVTIYKNGVLVISEDSTIEVTGTLSKTDAEGPS